MAFCARIFRLAKKRPKTKGGNDLAHCQICDQSMTAHKTEIVRHSKSIRHLTLSKQISSNLNLSQILSKNVTNLDVQKADVKLTGLLAENNLPFSLMDTLVPICKNIFPDSQIAKEMMTKRIKATAIMKHALSSSFHEQLCHKLCVPGTFFSLIMDETTDQSSVKQCAQAVIFFDNEFSEVETCFF